MDSEYSLCVGAAGGSRWGPGPGPGQHTQEGRILLQPALGRARGMEDIFNYINL